MRPLAALRFAPLLFAPLVACASAPPPAAAAPVEPAATPVVTAAATATAPEEAPALRTRPLDLTSACPHEVHLYYGEHPGDGNGQAASVTTGATIPVPRGPDGTVVVWVVDDKGFGLASVHVTKHMRHIRMDAACMKIDADSTR